MTDTELKQRTETFTLRIMKLADALPKTKSGHAIGAQIVHGGASVGANHRASCRARSKAEFIAKIGVVEEAADECGFWLELIAEGGLRPAPKVSAFLQEASELTATMAASRISAGRNRRTGTDCRLPIANCRINSVQSPSLT
ncbi:MAG: four helix bundle protein [Undibacterium sp.]|nr:four helix bundle protein [Opitutaceae bacterium]